MEMMMGVVADKSGLDISGTRMAVGVDVASAPALRVEAMNVTITLPRKFSEETVTEFRKAIEQCPLRGALRPEVVVSISFAMP
jgi:hypothetical protein